MSSWSVIRRLKGFAVGVALVLLAAGLVWLYIVPAWQTIVTDFPNYYVSAWAVRHGDPLSEIYNRYLTSSSANDLTPTFAPDGKSVYFARDRHRGYRFTTIYQVSLDAR